MSKYVIDDTTLVSLADAIREETGGSSELTIADIIEAIPTINQLVAFSNGTASGEVVVKGETLGGITINIAQPNCNYGLTGISFPDATGSAGFNPIYPFGGNSLEHVRMPNVTSLMAFGNQFTTFSHLTEFTVPKLERTPEMFLRNAEVLPHIELPSCYYVENDSFSGCTALQSVDLAINATTTSQVKLIRLRAFQNASALDRLILRATDSAWTLITTNALGGTKIEAGTGYIYVPRALVSTYQSATNWTTYSSQFRALEDYTTDGTTTGDLDPTKI